MSKLLKHAIVVLLLLIIFRIIFVVAYIPLSLLYSHHSCLFRLIVNSLRFDLQVTSYVMLLPSVLYLITTVYKKQVFQKFIINFRKIYFIIIEVLIAILSIVDLGFYSNFHSHINITFFDFFNEGAISLLITIWQEYHCLWYILFIVMLSVLLYKLIRHIEKSYLPFAIPAQGRIKLNSTRNGYKAKIAWIVYFLFIAICLRGSIGRFPLQIEDTFVCDNTQINNIVPNAPYMLKKAYKEKRRAFAIYSVKDLLNKYNFNSVQQALDIYTHKKIKLLSSDTITALKQALFATSTNNNKCLQPNVVIIYSESWSNFLFNLHSAECNMYMGLERHFEQDLIFRNFQSVQNGTIASIENLTVSTPFTRFFASKYRYMPLPTSIAIPFNKSGYTTEFLSGMDMAWENAAEALTHQQFMRICDKFSILKENHNATYNCIGVYDKYLFSALLKHLQKKQSQPKMITVMTTTNHPPFEFPSDVSAIQFKDKWYKQSCFAQHDKEVLNKYITGFLYYNKELACFLDNFKKSEVSKNTILIITGDHNVRSILDYNNIDHRWQYSVPLYIYLPPYLRKHIYRTLTTRLGCHDDIIPTLAPFAFKNTAYFKMGNNLLDTLNANDKYYSYNVEQVLPNNYKTLRFINARNMLREIYFQQIFKLFSKTIVR